jgi:hypothetical protein
MGCSIRLEIRKNDSRRRPASTRSFNYRVWPHSRRTRSPVIPEACQEINALSVIASSCRPRATRRDETAGVRRGVPLNACDGRRDSFAVSSLFKGLRIGKFRYPPISRERRRGRTRRGGSFGPARLSPPLHRRTPNGEDLAGFQFGFVCFQGFAGRKSFPSLPAGAASRTLEPLCHTREPSISGDRARPCCVRTEARGLGDLRQPPSRGRLLRSLASPAAGSTSGGGVSERAWRRILVIGGRTKRIA